jgi:hypothetical protein
MDSQGKKKSAAVARWQASIRHGVANALGSGEDIVVRAVGIEPAAPPAGPEHHKCAVASPYHVMDLAPDLVVWYGHPR